MGTEHLQPPVVDLKGVQERLAKAQKVHAINTARKSTSQGKLAATNPTPSTPPVKIPPSVEESLKKKIPKGKTSALQHKGRVSTSILPA